MMTLRNRFAVNTLSLNSISLPVITLITCIMQAMVPIRKEMLWLDFSG